MSNRPILSICIPTYNGASSYLEKTLVNILQATSVLSNDVEVIVSDNASTDSTHTLLEELSKTYFFRKYRNESNVGFKGNMRLLTDEYSNGVYTWIIGDDDFVDNQSIGHIVKILHEKKPDFVALGSQMSFDGAAAIVHNQDYQTIEGTYAEIIDKNCYDGNVMSSFISASIFKTDDFKKFPKEFLNSSGFDEYYEVFPNAYILASVFHDKKCVLVPNKIVTAVIQKRGWATDDNMYKIYTKILPELLEYLISLGIKKNQMQKTADLLVLKNLILSKHRIVEKKKTVNFLQSIIKILMTPRLIKRVLTKNI